MENKEFDDLARLLSETCKKMGISFCFTAISADGTNSFISMDANGDDAAFMCAGLIFDFCKDVRTPDTSLSHLIKIHQDEIDEYVKILISDEEDSKTDKGHLN